MDWDDLAFVKASKIRERTLAQLKQRPLSPKELADLMQIHFSQVSLVLKELTRRGLIANLTEKRTKGKLYGITKVGAALLERL